MEPPCPICERAAGYEHLAAGWLVCLSCGFAVLLDAAGALVEFATTNRSHPQGIWGEPRRKPLAINRPRLTVQA